MAEVKKEIEPIKAPISEEEMENKRKSSSLTGFIFSTIAFLTQGLCLVGLVLTILGFIFSIKGSKTKSPTHKSFSTVGKTLSIIQLVLFVVVPIVVAAIILFVLFLWACGVGLYFLIPIIAIISNASSAVQSSLSLLF